METEITEAEKLAHLRSLIKNVETVMFTTLDAQGQMRCRPMTPMEMDVNNKLWFFTNESSTKIDEIQANPIANIAYSHPDENTYVSIKAKVTMVNDKNKIEELWSPILKAWFPKGMEDPNLALLECSVLEAEYWDSSSSRMVQLFTMLKAAITGQQYDEGKHATLKL